MRLDKYVANVTDYSRSDVKKIIKAGRVSVAGEVIQDPRHNVDAIAEVMLDGEIMRTATYRYFMLNKPQGYVSATKDRQHLTVLELLEEDNLDQLHISGRLDIDTTGLILLTDDGQWSHRVTSPNKDCKKTYLVETVDPIDGSAIETFTEGIFLHNEKRRTLPAELVILDLHVARLTISEGKYHQVKRMFHAINNEVESLHRESIGSIVLDESLGEGEYRSLTDKEIASL
jgi:16S rRNA pseudouridine516 synthase